MMNEIDKITSQLNRLEKLLLRPETDVSWSNFNCVDEVLNKISALENDINNRKTDSFNELLFLLAPTADLQEISISSGWAEEFLDIAEKIEKQISHYLNRIVK